MTKKIIIIMSIVIVALAAVTVLLIRNYSYKISKYENKINMLEDKDYGAVANGRLKVKGNKLCNDNGTAVQLKGMSTHGISWYPKYTNAGAFSTIKEYGANVVRLSIYSETYMNANDPEEYLNYLYNGIENALSINMYVIVDWHVLKEENPNVTVEYATEFFEKISDHYGNHPHILYEICNEPNGETTWNDICEYSDTIIPVIRANAKDSIIIVGTPNYCQDVEEAVKEPLNYDNIMYSFHIYFDVSEKPLDMGTTEYCLKKINSGIPIFITEWGLKYDSEKIYSEETDYFIKELEKNKISWCNWSLSNKEESYSFIKNSCPKLSGWTDEDLTPGGNLIKKYLK